MTSVLIIGAGPVGLTAAIECARRGIDVTVLDRNDGPTDQSRAVGINRQTLQLLSPSGAADKILAESLRLENLVVHDNGKAIARVNVPQPTDDSPPFMCLLPQSRTERILLETLEGLGVTPQWGREVKSAQQIGAVASATFECGERLHADYLLGADGSHSFTRQSLGLKFQGKAYDEDWSLMDAALDWPYPDAQAAPFLDSKGAVLFIAALGGGTYRAISNRSDVEARVAKHMTVKSVLWRNEFKVSLRYVYRYGQDRIWIAGDAAHVHSPVGGMGMNLGIEDACDFASTLSGSQNFARFEQRRLASAQRVIEQTDQGYSFATTTDPMRRFLRNMAFRGVARIGFARRLAARRLFQNDLPVFDEGTGAKEETAA